jgi:hypothetical protein
MIVRRLRPIYADSRNSSWQVKALMAAAVLERNLENLAPDDFAKIIDVLETHGLT